MEGIDCLFGPVMEQFAKDERLHCLEILNALSRYHQTGVGMNKLQIEVKKMNKRAKEREEIKSYVKESERYPHSTALKNIKIIYEGQKKLMKQLAEEIDRCIRFQIEIQAGRMQEAIKERRKTSKRS